MIPEGKRKRRQQTLSEQLASLAPKQKKEDGDVLVKDTPPNAVARPPEDAKEAKGREEPRIPESFEKVLASFDIEEVKTFPETPAKLVPLPKEIPDDLALALTKVGVPSLFSHQAEAAQAIRNREDVVITTPTASGKTISFSVPTFEALLRQPASALLLFPLNALTRDQVAKCESLNAALPDGRRLRILSLNGGTPFSERAAAFSTAERFPNIVCTSPDLLHHLLSQASAWVGWRAWLRSLQVVVLDEAHSYVGCFGGHVANVLRRLLNAVDLAGGQSAGVRFVVSSATVGNSVSLARSITSRNGPETSMRLISESGARTPLRTVALLKPSPSPSATAVAAAAEIVRRGLAGIIISNSISSCHEIIESLSRIPALRPVSRCFYAALSPELKKEAIDGLRAGSVKVLVSTSALEAGVDVPSVDCCVIAGLPSSLMALRQRIGRAGRSGPGLGIIIPKLDGAADSLLLGGARPPGGRIFHLLREAPCESVVFNPSFSNVLGPHTMCCISESQSLSQDRIARIFGTEAVALLPVLERKGLIKNDGAGTWRLSPTAPRPHGSVHIRGGSESAEVSLSLGGIVLEKMPEQQALRRCFPRALVTSIHPSTCQVLHLRVEELAIDGKKGTASTSLVPPDAGQEPARPIIETTVRVERVWGEFFVGVGGNPASQLHVQHVWADVSLVLSGAWCRDVRIRYSSPFRSSYRAPALRLSCTPAAKAFLESRMTQGGLSAVAQAGFVFLHTCAHQLLSSAPVIVSGVHSSDVEEAQLGDTEAFLVDTAGGGTSACEGLFSCFRDAVTLASRLEDDRLAIRGGCLVSNKLLDLDFGLSLLK